MKFLVATDGTSESRNLIQFAFHLSEMFRGELVIAHVDKSLNFPVLLNKKNSKVSIEADRAIELAIKKLSGLYPNLWGTKLDPRANIHHLVLHGKTIAGILLDAIHREKIDYVVIGIDQNPGLLKKFMAQTTRKIIINSGCKVLCVPLNLQSAIFKNLIFLCETPDMDPMLQTLNQLSIPFQSKYKKLHINLDKENSEVLDQEVAQREHAQYSYEEIILNNCNTIVQGIYYYIQSHSTDLIVFCLESKAKHPIFDGRDFKDFYSKSAIPLMFTPTL